MAHKVQELTNYNEGNTYLHVINGGSVYSINLSNGTKRVARFGRPEYPENIDLKITNYCTGGCAWCHEKSTTEGKHADKEFLLNLLESFPGGIEVAIGGGDPVDYPHIKEVLLTLRKNKNVPSVTVNLITLNRNIEKFYKEVFPYIYGVGVSVSSLKQFEIAAKKEEFKKLFTYDNTVFHLIAGLWRVEDIKKFGAKYKELFNKHPKILILGYKVFGRGEEYYNPLIEARIKDLKNLLEKEKNSLPFKVISFDNLSVKQLKLKEVYKEEFNKHFLGEDGEYNLYIDAVKREASIASYEEKRVKIDNPRLKEVFNKVRKELLLKEKK